MSASLDLLNISTDFSRLSKNDATQQQGQIRRLQPSDTAAASTLMAAATAAGIPPPSLEECKSPEKCTAAALQWAMTLTNRIPFDDEGKMTSIGSIFHHQGGCRPCRFHLHPGKPEGCQYGVGCLFCHFHHNRRRRRGGGGMKQGGLSVEMAPPCFSLHHLQTTGTTSAASMQSFSPISPKTPLPPVDHGNVAVDPFLTMFISSPDHAKQQAIFPNQTCTTQTKVNAFLSPPPPSVPPPPSQRRQDDARLTVSAVLNRTALSRRSCSATYVSQSRSPTLHNPCDFCHDILPVRFPHSVDVEYQYTKQQMEFGTVTSNFPNASSNTAPVEIRRRADSWASSSSAECSDSVTAVSLLSDETLQGDHDEELIRSMLCPLLEPKYSSFRYAAHQ